MRCRPIARWAKAVTVGLALGCYASSAAAEQGAGRKPTESKAEKPKPKADGRSREKSVKARSEKKGREEPSDKKAGVAEVTVVGKGEEKMKVYKFEAVDVEGRMKAPQVIYFLRRVRKEFRAGRLGHRSFMLELSDTRRHASLR